MIGNTNYAMNMAIIKIIECTTFVKKNMEKHAETEGEEQQETTTVNDDENTKYEERQQTEVLTENDKIEDTDEQPELKDGDDEDNLTHSMSLNKKITSGNAKKIKRRQKGLQKVCKKSAKKEGNKTSSDSSKRQASKPAEANRDSSSTQSEASKFLTPNNKTNAAKERTTPITNHPDGKRQSEPL
ncbi:unnamed protein product [Mytilus edulis]|uniref:Uncharacterized protein n=1 Tax=Mytilus edulis TaxID=6550 RepID=A0A8S3TL18_MYTED|nr:unnamed protein product [Mytilus edulis]